MDSDTERAPEDIDVGISDGEVEGRVEHEIDVAEVVSQGEKS